MSKSSVVSAPKISASQLPTNAWAKGPPQTASPRSQSPAPSTPTSVHPTHSRRPSTLGQGIPIKDGVSIPRNNVGATKTGSVVSFGSIDDASAPISSSPAATPAIKAPTEGVKTFGSVPATISQMNGKSSVSSSTKPPLSQASSSASTSGASTSSASAPAKPGKMDIRKLFQNPSSSPSTSQSPSDTNSPSLRPINLPPQSQPSTSNAPMGQPSFTPFVPSGMRPPPNSTGPGVPSTPRSPNYSRQQMPNGNGPRPPNGVNTSGPPMQPPMGSPRLAPHPHPGQQPNMQPQPPVQMWAPYYYGMPPPDQSPYMYQPAPWGYGMSPQQMPPHPQQQHNLPHHPSSQGPPHPSMPMSPRNPPPQLQGGPPGTPTPSHASAVPHSPHPTPLTHTHSSSGSISGVSSPPPTPSSATMPGSARLNPGTNAFVPRLTSKIIIKSADGSEVNLENLKKSQSHQPSPTVTSPPISASPSGLLNSPSRRAIRIEDPEAKKKRQEKEKEEIQAKAAAAEKERQAKEEEEKKAREAKEAKEKAEEERLRKEKEEAERKEKEREEAERKAKEEAERKAKEEEEERQRIKAEEEEKQRLAEEERIREEKLRLEAEEKQRKEKEEEERRKEEEQARLRKEEEEAAIAAAAAAEAAAAAAKAKAEEESKDEEQEEGEVIEDDKPSTDDQEEKAGESKSEEKKSLRIDTTPPAPEHHLRRRPGPLDLSSAAKPNIPAALPSALATARIIDDLGRVPYPEGVRSPKVELNVNAKDGKFRYDRDFLLQFMSICKEKPDHLPALDAIGLESSTQSFPMSRTQSGRGTRPPNSRTTSVNIGFAGSNLKSGTNSSFTMGNFGTAGSAGKTSEERYHASNPSNRAVSMTVASSQFGGGRPGMQRTASTGGPGPGGSQPHGGRTRSKRGVQRPEANKPAPNYQQHNNHVTYGPGGIPLEPVAPLQQSENRWDRKAVSNVDPDSPELVDRKVKALLNKLTMEKFDSISDQIIAWANKSENQKDGRTLIQVIRLVFEKATDEAAWSEMYARLCRKMMEQISPKVQDDGIRNSDGKPITGGHLFRKYLLNRCQEDFERGWVNKEATAAAAATKASEDQAVKAAANGSKEEEEIALYSEEYYAAQKAKRQGLGLIKFIGELFKLQMLTERIMHECVKKLLGNVENPEEEEIESLCKLLTTVGQMLDTNKARAHMDVYFSRMKELTKSQNVSSRMQFMLQDIIELRERKWQTRNTVAAPTTIAKIHEAAAKDRAAQEKDSFNRMASMSRGGSRRGADRSEQANADGWTTTAPRPPAKVGDLSKFGQISKGAPMTFGPSSVFAGKKESKRESLSRTNSNANMFQMLQNVEAAEAAATTKTSRPPSRKTSIDLGPGGAPEPQRKRLILQPRTKPVDQDSAPAQESDTDEDEEVVDEPEEEMTEAEAKKKIAEDTKEFFAVRNLDEAEVYFSNLPSSHHRTLVDKLVSSAIESKEADATLVGNFFSRASSQKLCSPSEFEAGFLGIAEFLDDIAIDAPKATDLLAIMIKGAGLSEEQRTNISSKSAENGDKLLKLSS